MRQNAKPLERARDEQKRFQGAAVQITAIMRFVDERIAEGVTDEHDLGQPRSRLVRQSLRGLGQDASRAACVGSASTPGFQPNSRLPGSRYRSCHADATSTPLAPVARFLRTAASRRSMPACRDLPR
jgi:hypothetical protein